MEILVKALHEDTDFDLRLELCAGGSGLDRCIDSPEIQKPGLALAGYLASVRANRIEIIGNTEIGFLASLPPAEQRRAIDGLLCFPIGCVVVTANNACPQILCDAGNAQRVPIFRTPWPSSRFVMLAQDFLDEHLSPELSVHAVLVDVFGVGVLLTGQSGIGKSECALDLVLRGHRLVGDDVVVLRKRHRRLYGTGAAVTRHHMEVRGLGIINVRDLFGAAAVRENKAIELIVELVDGDLNTGVDRTGLDDLEDEILEIALPKVRLPVRPGRNLAAIVEVAARNHLLKLQGYHAARELQDRLERRLARARSDDGGEP